MGSFLKVLVALALSLPVGAYVAGTLVASHGDAPTRRTPIVLTEVKPARGSDGPSASPTGGRQSAGPTADPTAGPTVGSPRPGHDDSDGADGRPRAVNPTPHEVEVERADRARDRAEERSDRAQERSD